MDLNDACVVHLLMLGIGSKSILAFVNDNIVIVVVVVSSIARE